MNIAERGKIKTSSFEDRIRRSGITFEEAKQEQERNYGVVVKHVEVPGDPEGEEWEIKVGDRTLSFKGTDAKKKMEEWAEENDGVVVIVGEKTGKIKVIAGKLVDDIFLKRAAEDEAKAEGKCFGD